MRKDNFIQKKANTPKNKRVKKIILSMMIAIVFALSVPAGLAFAGNTADTPWKFTNLRVGGVAHTLDRAKTDYTSSWYQCKQGSGRVQLTVMGSVPGIPMIDVGSPSYYFWGPSAGYLVNYVKERTIVNAALKFVNVDKFVENISGVWSPDSV